LVAAGLLGAPPVTGGRIVSVGVGGWVVAVAIGAGIVVAGGGVEVGDAWVGTLKVLVGKPGRVGATPPQAESMNRKTIKRGKAIRLYI
jgi:hypothetical protein